LSSAKTRDLKGSTCNRILTGTETVGDSEQQAQMIRNEEAIQNLVAADIQNQ
jgi:hypothetical protein